MIPRTFPSTLNPITGRRQLVALFLGNVVGLQRWVDYIPVNFGKGTTLIENSYNNEGFISVQEITSGRGLVPFADYVPVFFDAAATDTWQVSATGFIPYGVSGVTSAPTLELGFTRGDTLDPRITFTRASTATRTNSSGVLVSEAINGPRFDYDPVTLAPKGLLIEEQRTNLTQRSGEIDSGLHIQWQFAIGAMAWLPSSTLLAPDGTLSGRTYTAQVGAANTAYQAMAVTASTVYTWSLYVRLGTLPANEYKIAFRDDTAGVFIVQDVIPTLVPVGGGWSKLTYTLTTPVGCLLLRCYPIRNTGPLVGGTISFWGAQFEAGSFATSYIPTTTAAATRAADVATMTGANFSNWYNQSEGTLFADGSVLAAVATNGVLADVNDGTTLNRMPLYRQSDAQPVGQLVTNNVNQAQIGAGAIWTTTAPRKLALAYAVNDFAFTASGGAVGADNVVTLAVMTRFSIGSLANTQWLNGHIRKIAYYPRRLANSELQALTS